MGKRLVSRAELSRIAEVTRPAVTKACKGQLAEACVGKSIDLDHPAVEIYLAAHGKTVPPREGSSDGARTSGGDRKRKQRPKPTTVRPKPAQPTKPARPPRPGPAGSEPRLEPRLGADDDAPSAAAEDDDIEGYAHLTIDEVVRCFGRKPAFRFWLDARKKIADIREKELKNDETTGRLIEREFVRVHVFGAIEAGNRRLLGDTPKTLARRLYALAKSGAPVEEAEKVVRELLSSQLKVVKAATTKALRNA